MTLRAYMCWSGAGDPSEAACLVFAHAAREARPLAHAIMQGWWDAPEWTDTRVRWLRPGRDTDWLFAHEADQAKLAADEAHAIESPRMCLECELWGTELDEDDYCAECAYEIEEGVK